MGHNDLTQGSIWKKLIFLALPIMGTSFFQMAYNLVDMIWIGKLGASAVAAIGTAGFFLWFSFSLITLTRVGAEVLIAQTLGSGQAKAANEYGTTAIIFSIVIGTLYGLSLFLLKRPLIGFFLLNDFEVEQQAMNYLAIVAISIPFSLLNQVIAGIYNASGISQLPFKVSAIGLVANMILDPILIFGFDLGISGAAIGTVIAQLIVTALMIRLFVSSKQPYNGFKIWSRFDFLKLRMMIKIALPVAMQNGLFTIIAMVVTRTVSFHGTTAIAVQKVGTQIEAITYMTANGFGAALSAFSGQNLGGKNYDRIRKGFITSGLVMGVFGLFTSILLYFGAGTLFKIFIDEEPALTMGIVYLKIISISQIFMCIEITMAGGLNGLGKSVPPALISVGFNALRIPFAHWLSLFTVLGLEGIWWTISVTSMLKGTLLVLVLIIILLKLKKVLVAPSIGHSQEP